MKNRKKVKVTKSSKKRPRRGPGGTQIRSLGLFSSAEKAVSTIANAKQSSDVPLGIVKEVAVDLKILGKDVEARVELFTLRLESAAKMFESLNRETLTLKEIPSYVC